MCDNLKNFKVLSTIGAGSFGTCFKLEEKSTKNIYACKVINFYADDYDDDQDKKLILMKDIEHPNIVKYHDHVINEETKTIFLIMEYCVGGDLEKLILKCRSLRSRFEEHYIWRVFHQICKAVEFCHNKFNKNGGIIHRDIKPANIFLDNEGNVKLGDFGLAKVVKKSSSQFDNRKNSSKNSKLKTKNFVGTPIYMSPEMINGKSYGANTDVWSIGCVIYEMCSLKPPFRGYQLNQLSRNITEGDFQNIPRIYSSDLQEIIKFMLTRNHEDRPTVGTILQHPTFLRNVLEDIRNGYPLLIPFEGNYGFSLNERKIEQKLRFSAIFGQHSRKKNPINDSSNGLKYSRKSGLSKSNPELSGEIYTKNHEVMNFQLNHFEPEIFNEAIAKKLQELKMYEKHLKQKEIYLDRKNSEILKREKKTLKRERILQGKENILLRQKEIISENALLKRKTLQYLNCDVKSGKAEKEMHDISYCSIDPETECIPKTIAKLDTSSLIPPRSFHHIKRKVTFKSPRKFTKYEIDKTANLRDSFNKLNIDSAKMENNKRHKSFLSRFNSIRNLRCLNNKMKSRENILASPSKKPPLALSVETFTKSVELANLDRVWTLENKRAAFEMLELLNSASNNRDNMKKFLSKSQDDSSLNRSRSILRRSVGSSKDYRKLSSSYCNESKKRTML